MCVIMFMCLFLRFMVCSFVRFFVCLLANMFVCMFLVVCLFVCFLSRVFVKLFVCFCGCSGVYGFVGCVFDCSSVRLLACLVACLVFVCLFLR